MRFMNIALREPAKAQVLGFGDGTAVEREVAMCLLDPVAGRTYEAVVSLTAGQVTASS